MHCCILTNRWPPCRGAGIVHRLDKETSGIMVVARSLRAHTSLVEQLQARQMSRVYRAVATGELITGGTVDAPIGRHPRDRKRMAVVRSGKAGDQPLPRAAALHRRNQCWRCRWSPDVHTRSVSTWHISGTRWWGTLHTAVP